MIKVLDIHIPKGKVDDVTITTGERFERICNEYEADLVLKVPKGTQINIRLDNIYGVVLSDLDVFDISTRSLSEISIKGICTSSSFYISGDLGWV